MGDSKESKHIENNPEFKNLNVNKGIEQPSSVNREAVQRFLDKRPKDFSLSEYVEGILSGNITILSRAVTLIESVLPAHQDLAQEIILRCLPYSGKSVRLGITGIPGAGKSTFIEALGCYLTERGHKLAVLAIDPSSERSKGSILGDKTRMEKLSINPDAYIRPSPSAGSLGGVAQKTRETIILCEAAGFDTIFVETVGVGQSETAVHSMVDFFLLILIAGAGDELQGIKRGIMEMADGIVINKADGQNIHKANLARSQYKGAIQLMPPNKNGWKPSVLTCSALHSFGIAEIWEMIEKFKAHTLSNNSFSLNRQEQSSYWMFETINNKIKNNFYQNPLIREKINELEPLVKTGKLSSFEAAKQLLKLYQF